MIQKIQNNLPVPLQRCFILLTTLLLCTAVPRFTCFAAGPENMIPVHVAQGTNLIRIARQYCTNPLAWKKIAQINHLKPPYLIRTDSTLRIPASLLITKQVTARVASLSGHPTLQTKNGTVPLHRGDQVLPGQTIVTGMNEYVHLVFPDNKHSRIGSESAMTLTYLLRLADHSLQAGFSLEKGKVVHAVNKKLLPAEHFETRLPLALTGVRGTEFRLKVIDKETNQVEILRGKVAVKAGGRQLLLPGGTGSKVSKGHPPTPPRPLPAPPEPMQLKDIYRLLPIVLPIPAHATARLFHLRITTDKQGTEVLTDITAQPGKKFIIADLDDGTYFLFLTAVDKDNFESPAGTPQKLIVRTSPAAPIVSKPKNRIKTFSPVTTLEWLNSEQAAFYHTQLATDPEFSTVIDEQDLREARMTTNELLPGDYYFRVRLVTEDNFSTLYSQTIAWTVLPQPKLGEAPPEIQDDGSIILRWPPVEGAVSYKLQVARDKKFNRIIINEKALDKPEYLLRDLDPGNYSIRVRTVMEGDLVSPWTPPQTMIVETKPFTLLDAGAVLFFLALIVL
jgi:hypothetical protein